jgi:iron(III) transport system permease protein
VSTTTQQSMRAWMLPSALISILGFLILFPIAVLVAGAFSEGDPVSDGLAHLTPSLQNFRDVLTNPNVGHAVVNSVITCAIGALLAVALGLAFSWIVVRTDTPCRGLIAALSMLPLFVPPLVAGIAWTILGSPRTGLINLALGWFHLPWKVNFYSLPGIVFVFGIYYAPYVYMFTASALRNMDPTFEEAAEISGAGPLRTAVTVTLPLIAPAIGGGALLSFVIMLGIYGVPAALGTPGGISVLTTYIYGLTSWTPPLYNTAAAVSVILLTITALLVVAQQRLLAGKSFATVGGKAFRPRQLMLGRWRWAAFAFAMIYTFVVIVLPMSALTLAAFRRFLFLPTVASIFNSKAYALVHFEHVLSNDLTIRSLRNTLLVGSSTAVIGGALAFAIAYTVHRSQSPGRRAIDVMASLPVGIPGLVVGVAYLWAWIGLPGGLYGSFWILALAFVARFLPDTVKALSASLLQIHPELEEAAWVCGRGRLSTIATIVVPLARPGIISAMTLLFVLAIRELGSSLFLYTNRTMIMAVMLLDYYESGDLGGTAAFSLLQILLLALLIGGAQWIAARGPAAAAKASLPAPLGAPQPL